MEKLIKKIIELPKRTVYQVKHIYWIRKVAKEHLKKVPFRFWIHDLDKIFLLRDKSVHSNKANHHLKFLLKNEHKRTETNILEMICDWESARFFKSDKPYSAVDYFEILKKKYDIPLEFQNIIQNYLKENNF